MSYDYAYSAAWEQLREEPSVDLLISDGFDYVYFDEAWWSGLSSQSQAALSDPCVKTVAQEVDRTGDHFRRLIDVSSCRP
jgi:hypothetical protein